MQFACASQSRLKRDLRHAAHKWRRQVKLHTNSSQRTTRRDEQKYHKAHARILDLCNKLATNCKAAKSAKESDEANTIQEFVTLIRPWSSCKTVQSAPITIVKDLINQQRRLEDEITNSSSRSLLDVAMYSLLVPFVAVAVGVAVVFALSTTGMSSVSSLESATYSLTSWVAGLSRQEWLIIYVMVPWVAGLLVLWTACRR